MGGWLPIVPSTHCSHGPTCLPLWPRARMKRQKKDDRMGHQLNDLIDCHSDRKSLVTMARRFPQNRHYCCTLNNLYPLGPSSIITKPFWA